MKSTSLLYYVLGAMAAVNLSATASFAQTATVQISGGSFTATVNSGVTTFNSGSALTAIGTINFSSVTGGTTTASSPTVGTPVNLANGISNGSIGSPSQSFTNAPLNISGTISSVSNTAPNVFNVGANVNSGNIVLPSSLVSSLSPSTPSTPSTASFGTTGSLFGTTSLSASDTQVARNIFAILPTIQVEKPFDNISSLSKSRIHPGLFAK
jgi:hypothetical protein